MPRQGHLFQFGCNEIHVKYSNGYMLTHLIRPCIKRVRRHTGAAKIWLGKTMLSGDTFPIIDYRFMYDVQLKFTIETTLRSRGLLHPFAKEEYYTTEFIDDARIYTSSYYGDGGIVMGAEVRKWKKSV